MKRNLIKSAMCWTEESYSYLTVSGAHIKQQQISEWKHFIG